MQVAELLGVAGKDRPTKEVPCALSRGEDAASGGAGSAEHLVEAVEQGGADAVLAASIFHYGEFTVAEAKEALTAAGVVVRPA